MANREKLGVKKRNESNREKEGGRQSERVGERDRDIAVYVFIKKKKKT